MKTVRRVTDTRSNAARRRKAAATIETAVVLTLFLLLLFGIIEYCRFIFVRQVMTNAAREGARFAVVNVISSELESTTKDRVNKLLKTIGNSVTITKLEVYNGDAVGNYLAPAGDAKFGEYIVVEIEGQVETLLPSFLQASDVFTIRTKALMYSEAN